MSKETFNNIDGEILDFLKDGEKSSTEIASKISRNYYSCIDILKSLEDRHLIEKIEVGKYTFWRLIKK